MRNIFPILIQGVFEFSRGCMDALKGIFWCICQLMQSFEMFSMSSSMEGHHTYEQAKYFIFYNSMMIAMNHC